MAFDTVAHSCSSPMVSITLYRSAASVSFKMFTSSFLHQINSLSPQSSAEGLINPEGLALSFPPVESPRKSHLSLSCNDSIASLITHLASV